MTKLHNFFTTNNNTTNALDDLKSQIDEHTIEGSLVFVFYGKKHDDTMILNFMDDVFPNVPFIGGTSHSGIMCSGELLNDSAIGLLVIEDAQGNYGVASTKLGDNPAQSAQSITRSIK